MGLDPNQSFEEPHADASSRGTGTPPPRAQPSESAPSEGGFHDGASSADGTEDRSARPFRLPTVPPITAASYRPPSTPPPLAQPAYGNNGPDYAMQFGQPVGPGQGQPVYGQPIMGAQPYALQPLPVHQNNTSAGNEEKWTLIAAVIFFLGFFCCPIWLAGAFSLKRGKYPRYIGSTSLCYAGVTFIIFVVYFIIGRTAGANCIGLEPSSCFDKMGCGWCRKQDKCTGASECGGITGHAESEKEYCNYFSGNKGLCREKPVCRQCGDDDDCVAIGTRC